MIPTKALLRSAEVFEAMRHAKDYGLAADNVRFDGESVIKRSREVAGRLSRGVEGLLRKNKVEVIWGEARLTARGQITVAAPARFEPAKPGQPRGARAAGDYSAEHIVLATGARPRVLPGLKPDGERIWTYFEAMIPKRIPESLLVVGAGAMGVDFASFYSGLGAKVAVIEALPQILPAEDDEISKLARARFERKEFPSKPARELRTPSTHPTDGLPRPWRAVGSPKSWPRMQ